MTAKNKPYEQFGPYVLFKKLESSSIGELWRAARVDANTIATVVALRRLTGGNREAMLSAITLARQVAPLLTGSSFAKEQVIDVLGNVPFVAHAYAGGRSLRHIVERARGATGNQPNPIPIDQALVIVEKVALSLATIGDLRFAGEKLSHGALIPEFVWISDDGEIRVAGQQLGKGFVASLKDPKSTLDIGRYLSPEYQHNGQVTKASEVYSLGAILYLTVTGLEPPDAASTSAFAAAIRAAKTMAGTPVPEEIHAILTKSLNLDPNARFASPADMKAALSALTTGGKYSATSFNLAMYVSNLLKKELEGEAIERDKEARTNFAPYIEALTSGTAPATAPAPASPAGPTAQARKSIVPIAVAATLVLALLGGGAYFMLGSKKAAPNAAPPKLASTVPVPAPKPAKQIIPEPILASPTPQTAATVTATTETTATVDQAAAEKKAFEAAVKEKYHQELLKLQSEYTAQLQKQQSKNAPVSVQQQPPVQVADANPRQIDTRPQQPEPSAAQFDAQRMTTTEAAPPVTTATQAPAPAVETQAPPQTQTQAPAPVVPQIHEGDVVDITQVDTVPRRTRDPHVVYPPMAARERAEATILATLLISERGDVTEVKILRGDNRFGFNDAAIRALKTAHYAPAVKDGKHVKTWMPQMIQFKP